MDFLQAIILSIVEGLTEFLPISSTGHLVLTSHLMQIAEDEFTKSFEIIIQLGAILAVLAIFWQRLLNNKHLAKPIIIGFLPSAILGLIFYSVIKTVLLGNVLVVLAALLIGGILLIIVEAYFKRQPDKHQSLEQITAKQALFIGFFQSLSLIPGMSRSASTIMGGMFSGLSRTAAVEFSFLLAIPTMFAATGLDFYQSDFSFNIEHYQLLAVGLIGSFITALLAIKLFLRYIQKHSLISFGIYRIILAVVYYLLIVH